MMKQDIKNGTTNNFAYAIDNTACLVYENSLCVLLIKGWVAANALDALILLDANMENPVPLKLLYYHRRDIDSIYGRCQVSPKKEHGFIGVALLPLHNSCIIPCIVSKDKIMPLHKIEISPSFNIFSFGRCINNIDIPISKFEDLSLILPPIIIAAENRQPKSEFSFHAISPVDNPAVSVLIRFEGDRQLLITQLLALSESNIAGIEITYIFNSLDCADLASELRHMVNAFNNMSISWISVSGSVRKTSAFNKAVPLTHGKYLVFADQDFMPGKPDWAHILASRFYGNQALGLISCGAADIYGYPLNGLYELYLSSSEAVKISLPNNFANGTLTDKYFPEDWLIMTPRACFEKIGGFDTRFMDYSAAVASYCQTLVSKGFTRQYEPEPFIVKLPFCAQKAKNENIFSKICQYHDARQLQAISPMITPPAGSDQNIPVVHL